MSWIRDTAAEIAEAISGREYLRGEYGTSFDPGTQADTWLADRCPLCGGEGTFSLTETPKRLCDWFCSGCPSKYARSGPLTGISPKHGDLVTLVALKHKCAQIEAVRRVLDRASVYHAKGSDPPVDRLKALQLAGQYFRWMLEQQPRVVDYLKGRGILWQGLQADFEIGGNDVSIHGLEAFLQPIPAARERLRQGPSTLIHRRSLTFQPAVVAPLFEEDRSFVGLQLRRCRDDVERRYLNKGLSSASRARLVYGLHLKATRDAVKTSDKVIVGKGVFDCWACHQEGLRHAVATLGEGITELQFARVLDLGVREMVLGFTSDKELKIASALGDGKLDAGLSHLKPGDDLGEAGRSGREIAEMIARRIALLETDKRAKGQALVRESHRRLRKEFDAGRYFCVPIEELLSGKGERMAGVLEHHRERGKQSGRRYLKVPVSFMDGGLHRAAGTALGLLMYLHSKKTGLDRPVSIRNQKLVADLGRLDSAIKKQKATLRGLGLLVDIQPAPGSKRNAWEHYPLFVPIEK